MVAFCPGPKCEIYTPKRDNKHPHPFHMRSPPSPAPARRGNFENINSSVTLDQNKTRFIAWRQPCDKKWRVEKNSRDLFAAGEINMERRRAFVLLCFICVFILCPASFSTVSRDISFPDLLPYNSVHGPEQIHIAYGNSASEMTVMWSTSSVQELSSSFVLYGLAPKNYSLKGEGKFALFTEGNPDGLHCIHRVVLQVSISRILFSDSSSVLESKIYERLLCNEPWTLELVWAW